MALLRGEVLFFGEMREFVVGFHNRVLTRAAVALDIPLAAG